jgi:hypothetical protein
MLELKMQRILLLISNSVKSIVIKDGDARKVTVSLTANNVFDVCTDRIRNYVNIGDGRNIYAMEG